MESRKKHSGLCFNIALNRVYFLMILNRYYQWFKQFVISKTRICLWCHNGNSDLQFWPASELYSPVKNFKQKQYFVWFQGLLHLKKMHDLIFVAASILKKGNISKLERFSPEI